MPKRKSVADSLVTFLLWWTEVQGNRKIASHQIQGVATRWITNHRNVTVNPATVDRKWRLLREPDGDGTVRVKAKLVHENEGAEDVWYLQEIDGRNVDTLLDLADRQGSLF